MTSDCLPIASRRAFLQNAAIATAAAWASSSLTNIVFAQEIPYAAQIRADGRSATITTKSLRRNVSVLMGAGGNIVVLPGPDGKVLVDAGYATAQKQISQALDGTSRDPLRHLIDTHWHFDHTDGNAWIHAAGATIIGHENTRKRLSRLQEIPAFHGVFPPSPLAALPTIVFLDERTFHFNSETISLKYYPPAHSDSDISVRFAEADVLHTGDTWFNGIYPFIDYHNGGSLDGMLAASDRNLRSVDEQTIIVPGHGAVGNKTNLSEYVEMVSTVRQKVATLKKQGRSVSETVAAKPSAEFDSKWGGGWIGPKAFVELIYAGV